MTAPTLTDPTAPGGGAPAPDVAGHVVDGEALDTFECTAYTEPELLDRCTHVRCGLRERNRLASVARADLSSADLRALHRAIVVRGPFAVWANEDGFAFAWGRIPDEGATGDGAADSLVDALRVAPIALVTPADAPAGGRGA